MRARFPLLFDLPAFRRLWMASAISNAGDWFGFVASNILILQLSGSAIGVAAMLLTNSLPNILLGPLAGVVIDRFPRKRVMIVANLVAALGYAGMAVSTSFWQAVLCGGIAGIGVTFLQPAQRALIPDLVGRERVLAANALLSGTGTVTMIFGPALAGALSAHSGVGVALWLNAASFVVAALLVAGIAAPQPAGQPPAGAAPADETAHPRASFGTDLRLGLRYVRSQPRLLVLMGVGMMASIAAAGLITLEVIFITKTLQGGGQGYGLLMSVAGVAALAATMLTPLLAKRFHLVDLYSVGLLLVGLSFFPYANATVLWVAIFWGAVQTIPWVMDMIVVETLAQRWTEPEMRGRVFSLFQMQRSAGKLLAAGLFAPLVDLLGPVLLMNAAGVIYTIVAIFALRGRTMMKQEPETEAPPELIPVPAE